MISKQANGGKDNIINEKSKNLQSKKEQENYITYDELSELMDRHKGIFVTGSIVYQPPIRPSVYVSFRVIHDESELNDINNDKIIKLSKDCYKVIKESLEYFPRVSIEEASDDDTQRFQSGCIVEQKERAGQDDEVFL